MSLRAPPKMKIRTTHRALWNTHYAVSAANLRRLRKF